MRREGNDSKNYKLKHTLHGHRKAISSVKFSPDGAHLATTSNDMTVRLWDTRTFACAHSFVGHELGISDVAWSPESNLLATASDDTCVKLWDYRSKKETHTFKGHTNYVLSVNFNSQGNLLASASFDGSARVWDIKGGTCLHRLSEGDTVVASHFNDGSKIVTGGFDGFLKIWNSNTGALLKEYKVTPNKSSVCFAKWSPNGKYILVGCFDGMWRLIDHKTGSMIRSYGGHVFNDYCIFAAFSLTGDKCIVSGSADNSVCIWNINSSKLLQKLEGHTDVVVAVDSHPTMDIIASGALETDKTIRVWTPDYLDSPVCPRTPSPEHYNDCTSTEEPLSTSALPPHLSEGEESVDDELARLFCADEES